MFQQSDQLYAIIRQSSPHKLETENQYHLTPKY